MEWDGMGEREIGRWIKWVDDECSGEELESAQKARTGWGSAFGTELPNFFGTWRKLERRSVQ
jgi:hypothetical protein